jgi:hypothetical protein
MAWFGKKSPPNPAPAKPSPSSGGGVDVGELRELPDISRTLSASHRAFLVTCCDTHIQGSVTWPELGIVRRVVFDKIDGDQLHLGITNDGDKPYECRPRTQCAVTFYFRDRMVCFMGYEESRGAGQRQELLVLRMPTQLAIEGRTRFRIPILPKLELEVALHLPQGRVPVPEPVDISVAGMMLSFPKDFDPGMKPDDLVELELAREEDRLVVPCSVRNRIVRPEQIRYGVLFHAGSNGFDYAQDRELTDLIMGVERFWARNRNR